MSRPLLAMNIQKQLLERFDHLIQMGEDILQSATTSGGDVRVNWATQNPYRTSISYHVNIQLVSQWKTNTLYLLEKVFGKDSSHFHSFENRMTGLGYERVKIGLGILIAAKDDYVHSYIFDVRTVVQAEVFDDFLQQATHLLDNGYYGPAAIIAGIVLEAGLRKLCDQNNAAIPAKATIGPMNDALAKTGLYGTVVKQQISAFATIRNHAAHGQWKEFTSGDVSRMIGWVHTFMENSFGNARLSLQ
ncbi:MAG: DUF4145 domain-containing protein [Pyrinomonadaceae bacterium]